MTYRCISIYCYIIDTHDTQQNSASRARHVSSHSAHSAAQGIDRDGLNRIFMVIEWACHMVSDAKSLPEHTVSIKQVASGHGYGKSNINGTASSVNWPC